MIFLLCLSCAAAEDHDIIFDGCMKQKFDSRKDKTRLLKIFNEYFDYLRKTFVFRAKHTSLREKMGIMRLGKYFTVMKI